jgi:outer membrane protein assembly factor BamB
VGALGLAWTGTTGSAIYFSSPTVANGVVYVGSEDDKLYAYAAGCASGGASCAPLWTAAAAGMVIASPAVSNGVVYISSYDDKVYAFDAAGVIGCSGSPKTCVPLWSANTGDHMYSSPTVAGGVVYVGSEDGKLYAFDAAGNTGCSGSPKVCSPLWTATTGALIEGSPAVSNGVVYIGSGDRKLYAFDAAGNTGCSGSPKVCLPLWTGMTGFPIQGSSPAVVDGVVYVGSNDDKLYAFDANGLTGCTGSPKTCIPLWTGATADAIDFSGPAVADGVVYVGSEDHKLYAYAVGCASDGSLCAPLWTATTGGAIDSSPAVANGVVYVGSNDGKVYALDAAGVAGCSGSPKVCTPLWSATTGDYIDSSPAIANGVVYVGSGDGKLYAFDLNPADHLVLSPASATIAAGGSQAYTAKGFDAFGHSLGDVTAGTTFTISGSGSCTGHSCAPTAAGDYTVTGTYGSATGTAALHVQDVWTQFHAGPTRTGRNALETSISPSNVDDLSVAWTAATGGAILSSPAISDGVAYVGSDDHKLYAFPVGCGTRGGSCSPLWTATTGDVVDSSPAVADGVVYVGSYDGTVYAFQVGCASGGGTCTPLWTGATGGHVNSSPAVADGFVYVGSSDGKLYAFAVGCGSGDASCAPTWTATTGEMVGNGSPAVASGVVYIASDTGHLYAFAEGCATGGGTCTAIWSGVIGGGWDSWSTPTVADGMVFVGSYDGHLYAFQVGCNTGGGTCSPAWTAATGANIFSSPAVADGVVYVGSYDRNLYAFAVGCGTGGATCSPLWTGHTNSYIYSSPAVANGVVYVGSFDRNLYAFAVGCASGGGTCSPLWTAETGAAIFSSPAVADGVVYVGSEDGKLYAFGLDQGDWTQFHNGPAHTGYNAAETTISPTNVAGLGLAWTGAAGGPMDSSPTVSNGVVYAGSNDGKLYAYSVDCATGGAPCTPLWTGTTGGPIGSVAPAVAGGVVYVGSADGKLYAYSVGCATGGGSCSPLWTGATGGAVGSSATVVGGVVYVGSDDGKVYAFQVGCASGGGTCEPIWTGDLGAGADMNSSPAVADGVVYIGSQSGTLYAFAVGCATGGGICSPLWTADSGGEKSSPTVADGVVYIGSVKYDKLYAFSAGCRTDGGVCDPLWTGDTGSWVGSSPAVANGVVYVGSGDGKVYAFQVGCASGGGSCTPLWTGATGNYEFSSPAVANGVVYAGSHDGHLYAFAVGCNTGGGSCSPLWAAAAGAGVDSSPSVVNGRVYASSKDGKLYAYSLQPTARISGTVTGPDGTTPLAGISVGAVGDTFSTWAKSGSDGRYWITVLRNASYSVTFQDPTGTYADGCYSSGASTGHFTFDQKACTPVDVGGSDHTGIDVAMPHSLQISGKVTESDGTTPLEGIWVGVKGDSFVTTYTGSDGGYSVAVNPGSYSVSFTDEKGSHVGGCYVVGGLATGNEVPCAQVTVVASDVSGIDVSMPEGHRISGTISGTDKTLLGNINVKASVGPFAVWVSSGKDGFYSLNVLPGSYNMWFHDNNSQYADGCYAAGVFSADPSICTSVDASTSDATGIDVVMPVGLHIRGTVRDSNGTPLENVTVAASNGAWYHTDKDGAYSLVVPPGSYTVSIDNGCYSAIVLPGHFTDTGACTSLTLTDSDVTGIDMAMFARANIQGTVTGPDGPLANVTVSVGDWGPGDFGAETVTDGDGNYSISVLQDASYTVSFHDNSGAYVDVCYRSGGGYDGDCTPVSVATSDVTGIDVEMALGVHITGTVTGSGGARLASISVSAEQSGGHTAADGTYSITVLPGHDRFITFRDDGSTYADGCYSDTAPGHITGNDCTKLLVGASDVHDINVQMQVALHISGTITEPDGTPLGHIDVNAGISFANTDPNAGGAFSLAVMPGSYEVWFTPNNGTVGLTGCYSASATGHFTTDAGACTPVVVTDTDVTGLSIRRPLAPGQLDHLVLTPSHATVAPGANQAYTAEGWDAYGTDLGGVTAETIFTISGGSCTDASCTATAAGNHVVTGTDGRRTGTATLLVHTAAAASDWPQFHQGASHSGNNPSETTLSASSVLGLGVSWTGSTGAGIYTSPAVADGVVYVGSDDGKLYAYEVGCASGGGTCTPLWTGATSGTSSPAVADGVVYAGSVDGKLNAYSVGCASGGGTCTPLWTATTGDALYSSPVVADGVVYVGSMDGNLYAFAVGCASGGGTCTPLWTGSAGAGIYSSPAVADGVVYVGSNDDKLYAFAVGCNSGGETCTPLWTGATDAMIGSSPAVADGRVFVGSEDGKLYAFAVGCNSGGGTCTPLWTGNLQHSGHDSSPAVSNGVVYVGSDDAKLYAFAVDCASGGGTCAPLWTGPTGVWTGGNGGGWSAPAVANGVVYVGAQDGKLYAFAVGCNSGGGTCTPLWTGATGDQIWSSPAVANGVVYVGSVDGKLYAFGLDHGALDHLVLSPPSAIIAAGGSQAYTAEGFDAHGNSLGDVTSATTFTVDSSTSCPAHSCSAAAVGDHAVNGADGTATGTATLHVNPAGATTLVVSGFPSPDVAGVAHNVTVTAKDPYGNTATGYTGTVHFTSTDTQATLPANYVFTSTDAGTHVFILTLKTAATQSVTATDTVTASIKGSQSGIVVNPAAISKLVVAGLTTPRTAGVAGSIRVTATDAYGNKITGYVGTIHFTSTDTKAKLPANYKFTATDAGTHVFILTVMTKGTWSVTATDTTTATIKGSQTGIVVN